MTPVVRIQHNMLAKAERRLLNWLCARLPGWLKPDHLTAIGFAGSAISATGYVLSNWGAAWLSLAVAGYFINWFGDSLDGSLARYRKIERPRFGYFLDHSTDSAANLLLVTGLGLSPYVRLDVAMFGIAAYLLLSIHTFLAARVVSEFRLSYVSAGPTELRLILIALTISMAAIGPAVIGTSSFTPFDVLIALIAAVMIILYVVQTASTARKLKQS